MNFYSQEVIEETCPFLDLNVYNSQLKFSKDVLTWWWWVPAFCLE
jgi:hypothetical protein